jgi:tetratricopeptide (TPR) repeat protein
MWFPQRSHRLPLVFALSAIGAGSLQAQEPAAPTEEKKEESAPAAPATPNVVSPATLNRLFDQADKAFADKDYETVLSSIRELLQLLGDGKNYPEVPYELLYFNLGLANLMLEKHPEAQAAFEDCLKRFPKGEYTSRSQLGLGRALMKQEGAQNKEAAIKALRVAAEDPKFRSEAGLWLAQVLTEERRHDEAKSVFRFLMGSDVRTPQQTGAAVEVIGLLADSGDMDNLLAYLDRVSNQPGVRDSVAWFANQLVVIGDKLVASQAYGPALAIYRSVPPRSFIVETQASALEEQRKRLTAIEARIKAEEKLPMNQRARMQELAAALKPAIEQSEKAFKAIEEKKDLDAALLMRRGRCLFYLDRHEEALVCFRALRTKYADAADAEAASYAEIVILNRLNDVARIRERCDVFLRRYPQSANVEQVASLAGELLVQSGDWRGVGAFYRDLESRFPTSENVERYVFFQGLAYFQDGNFAEALPMFSRVLKDFPGGSLSENAMYYVAMSNFLSNKYKETLEWCGRYLERFPDGRYAGDMRYRLSFIDFNDKQKNQSEKIIREVNQFVEKNPHDESNGSLLCLLADTYKREGREDEALDAYSRAVWSESPDDVIQYGLDSATAILQGRKDWAGVAALHGDFLKRKPYSPLALMSASWVAKMKARDGRADEAAAMLADSMKPRIADPASEQVEFLIDELVKTLVPRKKPKDIDLDAIDQQLQDVLGKIVSGQENATTSARIYYARARLAELVRRNDRSELYLKGIATTNARDPSGLSPALLSVAGDILLKSGDLEGAESMFKRLSDRFRESMFSDAGPVGMGYVALARDQPEEALRIFDDALENNPGMSRFKETMIGKLEALAELGRHEPAVKLALQIVGDKTFRGESAAKAYLILADVYRKQSASKSGAEATDLLKQAHGTYQRVYVAYQGFPELCAEAYWQAHETAKQLGEAQLAEDTLKQLKEHPKLQNTSRVKQLIGTLN